MFPCLSQWHAAESLKPPTCSLGPAQVLNRVFKWQGVCQQPSPPDMACGVSHIDSDLTESYVAKLPCYVGWSHLRVLPPFGKSGIHFIQNFNPRAHVQKPLFLGLKIPTSILFTVLNFLPGIGWGLNMNELLILLLLLLLPSCKHVHHLKMIPIPMKKSLPVPPSLNPAL